MLPRTLRLLIDEFRRGIALDACFATELAGMFEMLSQEGQVAMAKALLSLSRQHRVKGMGLIARNIG